MSYSAPLLAAIAVILALAPAASATPRDDAARVLALFDHEPGVLEVQDAAARYAKVHPEVYDTWLDQAAWAYALPDKVEGEIRHTGDDDKDVRTTTATNTLTDTVAKDQQLLLQLEVRWNLSRLLYNKDKLTAAKDISKLVERREDVLTTINKLYFARRSLQANAVLDPPGTAKEMITAELRVAGLTADLDALTGGWFSQELAKRQKAAASRRGPTPARAAGPAPTPRPAPAIGGTTSTP